jgi:lysophospholipase L1-like esterase
MLRLFSILLPILLANFFFYCKQDSNKQMTVFPANDPLLHYTGRIDFSNPLKPKLSGAGCYIQARFTGNSIETIMQDQHLDGNQNYLSIVLDGEYKGRIKTIPGQTHYLLADKLVGAEHTILIGKATEAAIGYVEFGGFICQKLLPAAELPERKIEFIGNSITCGTGLDITDTPCDSGTWYDQQNAYLAYGPVVARRLNTRWFLSSVSGIGMERNWNSPGPTLPQVYQNTFLHADSSSPWDFSSYVPDLVVICLGTNDFSDGDGKTPRPAPDSTKFIDIYIKFLKLIRKNYPQAVICCLSSPVLQGEKAQTLQRYLDTIVENLQKKERDSRVGKFFFAHDYNHGCTGHPDRQEHQKMADEMEPFIKKIMNW